MQYQSDLLRKLKRMTILVGMVGSDGMILAADQARVRPASDMNQFDDKALIRKIEHLPKHGVAYAGVGDIFTWRVGRVLEAALDDGKVEFEKLGRSLEALAFESINVDRATVHETYASDDERRIQFEEHLPRGLLMMFYGSQTPQPQLWTLSIDRAFCHAQQVGPFIMCGASANVARFFGTYFREGVPIKSLQLLAAHIVLAAHRFDSLMIDGLNVAVFDSQGFRLLNGDENADLRGKSDALDAFIQAELFKVAEH
jgi:hypothetical protein